MSDLIGIHERRGLVTGTSLEFYDVSTGRTIAVMDQTNAGVPALEHGSLFTATLAQINASSIIVPADANRTIVVVGFRLVVTGNFATLTDVRLSDTSASPIDIVTIAQAQLINGAIFVSGAAAGVTFGPVSVQR